MALPKPLDVDYDMASNVRDCHTRGRHRRAGLSGNPTTEWRACLVSGTPDRDEQRLALAVTRFIEDVHRRLPHARLEPMTP